MFLCCTGSYFHQSPGRARRGVSSTLQVPRNEILPRDRVRELRRLGAWLRLPALAGAELALAAAADVADAVRLGRRAAVKLRLGARRSQVPRAEHHEARGRAGAEGGRGFRPRLGLRGAADHPQERLGPGLRRVQQLPPGDAARGRRRRRAGHPGADQHAADDAGLHAAAPGRHQHRGGGHHQRGGDGGGGRVPAAQHQSQGQN